MTCNIGEAMESTSQEVTFSVAEKGFVARKNGISALLALMQLQHHQQASVVSCVQGMSAVAS